MAKNLITTLTDTRMFIAEWLANPKRTGSLVPSSKHLSAAMSAWLPANPDSFVLELGPGTGVVTEAMLARGLRQEKLVVIEHNPKLADLLRERFPKAQVICGDAWQMDALLRERQIEFVGAVVSSLPLLNFSEEQAEALAQKIKTVLEPQGKWVQFTYRIHKLRPRGASSFDLHATKIVWLNFPPARVCVFQK